MSFINTTLFFLPSVIFLNFCNKWYHLSHGAIPEFDKNGINEIKKIKEFLLNENENEYLLFNENQDTHSLKWGDFNGESFVRNYKGKKYDYMPPIYDRGINYFNGGRALFGPKAVRKYLETTNIECIISGHQDNRSLLILSEENTDDIKLINNHMYIKDEDNKNLLGIDNNYSQTRLLYPKKDFMALTTSTATVSKDVENTCFLELRVNKIKYIITKCNQ